MYNPRDWYWLAGDGRLFSSSRGARVKASDAEYKAWKKIGYEPTVWPVDSGGQQTDEELQSVLEPFGVIVSETVLDAACQRKIGELTNCCAEQITSGYRSSALGSEHTYPSKHLDQLNMMGSVTDALTPRQSDDWRTPFWCADDKSEWALRDHSAAQIIAAGKDGKAHVVACQSRLADLSKQVMSAKTLEEVDAIRWG